MLRSVPRRSFYFSCLSGSQRTTDFFPLNIGYNKHYKHHDGYKSKSLMLRRLKPTLTHTFRDHYFDLLQAIATKNYSLLEILCEEQLTETLAAAIYDTTKVRNY
jgi:hypothetical protein